MEADVLFPSPRANDHEESQRWQWILQVSSDIVVQYLLLHFTV
jgi:hypothetical protein